MDTVTLLVAAIITDADGRVLLTGHAPTWKMHLPDGDVRFGESLRQALVRSFDEDFGASILPDALPAGITETIGRGGRSHYVTLHFRCRHQSSEQLVPKPGLRHGFYGEADVRSLALQASTRDVLTSVLGWKL